ncbi:MAG: HD domain-containing protein [Bacillota bacterium]
MKGKCVLTPGKDRELATPEVARACIFWGKLRSDGSQCLPLTAHCLDVAVVFRALWLPRMRGDRP